MIRLQQHRHALGSEVYITLVGTDEHFLAATFALVWQDITLFEHTFSRFLPDSELSYVNERAGIPTEVSQEFVALARCSYDFSKRTDGLYNPFVLPALQRAGYKGSWPHVAVQGDAPDFSDRSFVSGTALQLDGTTVTIPADSALDFGGIGKGYALDQLGELLRRQGIKDYWLSLGGDILASGHDVDGSQWRVEISQALDQDASCGAFLIGPGPYAVATSGTMKRAGKGWNHLIDPRTGQATTSDIISATVAAESGAVADVYAKCLLLVGSKQAPAFAKRLGIAHYVLQTRTKQGTVEVIKQGDMV